MKAKLSIILFLLALALMATNNIVQGLISVTLLGISTHLMNTGKKEVEKAVDEFETKISELFKLK
ncbi:hypothetical protein D0T84_16360 [Dysgonomonas sp. 521]|uniref:hypothetical protein n=1 Tax=Dysgonomonas sp. 521 TaxID=2302932 RepID=UPI0013D0F644|nr:hypothetical protein [Dysgonomonas sp. 521]NDV96475.1 hypothetical protein [Dysgonomonas sp. 521]